MQSTLGITTLFVTHDQGEALGMSDRVAVMRDGKIVQIDTPQALYDRPNSHYVANFVGRTNLIEVAVRGGDASRGYQVESCELPPATFEVAGDQHHAFVPGERCLLAARPEHCHIGAGDINTIRARVLDVTYRGSSWNVDLCGSRDEPLTALVRAGSAMPAKGDLVPLTWAPARCFLLKIDGPGAASDAPPERRSA